MEDHFYIAYQLQDAGWATVKVDYGSQTYTQGVSYLHDSLKDLTDLALALQCRGSAAEANALFLDEPGKLILSVSSAENSDTAEVGLVDFDYRLDSSNVLRETKKTLWQGQVSRHKLVENIRMILEEIDRDIGDKEYLKRWVQHPFPRADYLKLIG